MVVESQQPAPPLVGRRRKKAPKECPACKIMNSGSVSDRKLCDGMLFNHDPPRCVDCWASALVELTEAETEYAVNVVKHVYDGHIVFQYNCTNTIPEQLLEDVTVIVDTAEAEDFAEIASKPLRSLPYDTPGQTYVAFQKPEGVPAVGKFSNNLRFMVKEVDPSTGEVVEEDGMEEDYQLEDVDVVAADYMLKVGVSNFRNAWESIGADFEKVDEYGLGPRENLSEAVNAVISLLGMQPCEVG